MHVSRTQDAGYTWWWAQFAAASSVRLDASTNASWFTARSLLQGAQIDSVRRLHSHATHLMASDCGTCGTLWGTCRNVARTAPVAHQARGGLKVTEGVMLNDENE
jgi:hypothetical protein